MAELFKVTEFKATDFKDANSNYWCDIVLEGLGEPAKIVVKDPTQFHSGMELYGHIEVKKAKSGNDYNRFYRDKQPDNSYQSQGSQQSTSTNANKSSSYVPRDDMAIRAQWAIGQSMAFHTKQETINHANVEELAEILFAMVDRVKSGDGQPNQEQDSLKADAPLTGREKFQQAGAAIQQKVEAKRDNNLSNDNAMTDDDWASLAQYQDVASAEQQFNPDEIPF